MTEPLLVLVGSDNMLNPFFLWHGQRWRENLWPRISKRAQCIINTSLILFPFALYFDHPPLPHSQNACLCYLSISAVTVDFPTFDFCVWNRCAPLLLETCHTHVHLNACHFSFLWSSAYFWSNFSQLFCFIISSRLCVQLISLPLVSLRNILN